MASPALLDLIATRGSFGIKGTGSPTRRVPARFRFRLDLPDLEEATALAGSAGRRVVAQPARGDRPVRYRLEVCGLAAVALVDAARPLMSLARLEHLDAVVDAVSQRRCDRGMTAVSLPNPVLAPEDWA
ncbi:hypothetical protein V6K52_10080 [Knoellia sp. S7-12]|uniref:hypothetical protein n=1 Tax=Knoellia sp. S7-12 TaxID=3126698 RepID=UPI003366AD5A